MNDTPPHAVPYVPGPAPSEQNTPWVPDGTQSQQASPPPAPSTNRPILIAIAAMLGIVVLAGGAAAVWYVSGERTPVKAVQAAAVPQVFALSGVMVLRKGYDGSNDACFGTGGFSDIAAGAQVTVTDQAGATIALGKLTTGRARGEGGCSFGFYILDVPLGKGFYGVEVSHRGVIRFAESEVTTSQVKVSLG